VTLALLVIAQFVVVLDFSIVQIALPTMRTELGISLADSQWIVSAYGLTFAGLLLLSGRISDLYGRRKLFSIGLIVFAISSLAAGLAPSELVLIAARAAQGIGAAMASATSLSLVIVSFAEGPERNRALSAISAVQSAGFAAGVVLGGVLTASLGWRSIFFINVPIGIIAALLAFRYIAESRGQSTSKQLDIPGAITVTGGLSLLIYALTIAANTSLLSITPLALLGLAGAVLVAFLAIERRSKNPLMPLSFLRRGAVFTSNAIAVLLVSVVSSMIFLLTIYLQQIQGFSPLSAGLAFLPTGLVFLVVSGFLSARFVTRFGLKPVLVVSMIVLAFGFLLLSTISPTTPFLSGLLPIVLVISTGSALGWTAFYIAALSGARRGEEGLASGVVNTSVQIGGPIGLAVSVTIASTVAAHLLGHMSVSAATVVGFNYSFLTDALIAGGGLVFALLLRRSAMPAAEPAPRAAVNEPTLEPSPPVAIRPQSTGAKKDAMTIGKILVAVDGSENGYRAAETAMKLAKDYQAELVFLRVVTTSKAMTPGNRGAGSDILKESYDSAQKEAQNYVDSLVENAKSIGVSSARGVVIRAISSPASAIVENAKSETVDLIVIGTRGYDRPKRILMGSVSGGVVADSDIQVLVVK
jgi:EmrB/QacA subfamily drug resistance transporter